MRELPPLDLHPVDGIEVKELTGHEWHVATGQPNPCISETMWWATQPAELTE